MRTPCSITPTVILPVCPALKLSCVSAHVCASFTMPTYFVSSVTVLAFTSINPLEYSPSPDQLGIRSFRCSSLRPKTEMRILYGCLFPVHHSFPNCQNVRQEHTSVITQKNEKSLACSFSLEIGTIALSLHFARVVSCTNVFCITSNILVRVRDMDIHTNATTKTKQAEDMTILDISYKELISNLDVSRQMEQSILKHDDLLAMVKKRMLK